MDLKSQVEVNETANIENLTKDEKNKRHATWKERIGHFLFADRAHKTLRMPGNVERVDDLAFDDLLAASANRAKRRQEAL